MKWGNLMPRESLTPECLEEIARIRVSNGGYQAPRLEDTTEWRAAQEIRRLRGAAAFFRSALLSGETVGPDHCAGCRTAYAALDGEPPE